MRAMQRQLDARTAEQKRLADRVSCWEAGVGGQKISPPATVRKEKGLGGRAGAAGMQGRRLGFGAGREQQQQMQQQLAEREEKEREDKERERPRKEEAATRRAAARREEAEALAAAQREER